MTEFDFNLSDRLTKIQSINDMYNLNDNAYISFSGGKDSTVLSHLIDLALPNNKIPRVFIDTGIEYKLIKDFVSDKANSDDRVCIIKPSKNIRDMLEDKGYPFKSKEHSQKVALYQKSGMTKTIVKYLGHGDKQSFLCPDVLKYQFTDKFTLKVSDRCCYELKKIPAQKWSDTNNRPITITGIRQNEGGLRKSVTSCTVFYDDKCKDLHKFHPLLICDNAFIDEYVKRYDVKLCALYYAPYNFERTGCCGCPYNPQLQKQLDIMAQLLPQQKKQCELIWGKVYEEMRRKSYRLRDLDLFDKG